MRSTAKSASRAGPSYTSRRSACFPNALANRPPTWWYSSPGTATLAGMGPEAIHWSTLAGDDALGHLSPTEAARHFEHALEVALELGRPL